MMRKSPGDRVLVTGASGYVAGHCVRELLEHGYAVRGTVRDLTARDKVAHLHQLAEGLGGELELVEADLSADAGWSEAVAGCAAVLHVASPNPPETPRDENDLIRPAVDGTLRVLRASAASPTVRRVVVTSSVVAIAGNRSGGEGVRTEEHWTDVDRAPAYARSKTLAERAAWRFVESLPAGQELELVVVNPGMVLGPMLRTERVTSLEVVRRLVNREVPASPRIGFAIVDVRDLAVAHRLAMEVPEAAGNRYLCAGEHLWMRDMARILAAELGPNGLRVPTGRLPDWMMWVIARFDRTARLGLDFIGRRELVSSAKAVRELGWTMRPARESIVDSALSLIEHGMAPRAARVRLPAATP